MDEKLNELISYVNSEWAQSLAYANQKIAHLIMDNKKLLEENEEVKRELNRLNDQKPTE